MLNYVEPYNDKPHCIQIDRHHLEYVLKSIASWSVSTPAEPILLSKDYTDRRTEITG